MLSTLSESHPVQLGALNRMSNSAGWHTLQDIAPSEIDSEEDELMDGDKEVVFAQVCEVFPPPACLQHLTHLYRPTHPEVTHMREGKEVSID